MGRIGAPQPALLLVAWSPAQVVYTRCVLVWACVKWGKYRCLPSGGAGESAVSYATSNTSPDQVVILEHHRKRSVNITHTHICMCTRTCTRVSKVSSSQRPSRPCCVNSNKLARHRSHSSSADLCNPSPSRPLCSHLFICLLLTFCYPHPILSPADAEVSVTCI